MHQLGVNLWSGATPYLYLKLPGRVKWVFLSFTTMHVYTKNPQHAYWTAENLDPDEFPLETRHVADTDWIIALNKGGEGSLSEIWLTCGHNPSHGDELRVITGDRSISVTAPVTAEDRTVFRDLLGACLEVPHGAHTPSPVCVQSSGDLRQFTMDEWRYVHADAVANLGE